MDIFALGQDPTAGECKPVGRGPQGVLSQKTCLWAAPMYAVPDVGVLARIGVRFRPREMGRSGPSSQAHVDRDGARLLS